MKRFFALLLALVMCLSLAACGGGDNNKPSPSDNTPPASSQQTPGSGSKTDASSSTPDPDPASGENHSTVEELSGWLATKTGRFYSQFTDGRMYMEYETQESGTTVTVISATNGEKIYSESKMDGQSMGVSIIDGQDMYLIDHNSKVIIKTPIQATGQEVLALMLEEEDVDPADLVTGTREVEGKTYDTEEWIVEGGKSVLCFDGDQLAYIIAEYEGMESMMKVNKVSAQVDDSLFELPEGYQMMSM